MKYLLIVDFQPGVAETPMDEWEPEEIEAHLDYYGALHRDLESTGELVDSDGPGRAGPRARSSPRMVSTRRWSPMAHSGSSRSGSPATRSSMSSRRRGPSRSRARISAVPGPGGRSTEQPIIVRQIMESSPSNATEMEGYLETARGRAR